MKETQTRRPKGCLRKCSSCWRCHIQVKVLLTSVTSRRADPFQNYILTIVAEATSNIVIGKKKKTDLASYTVNWIRSLCYTVLSDLEKRDHQHRVAGCRILTRHSQDRRLNTPDVCFTFCTQRLQHRPFAPVTMCVCFLRVGGEECEGQRIQFL